MKEKFRTVYGTLITLIHNKIPVKISNVIKVYYNVLFYPLFCSREKRRYRQVYGGRGSGKSFVVALFSVLTTLTKKRRKVLYLRQTMTSSEDSTYADVKMVMDILCVTSLYEERGGNFTCKLTGSKITFKGIRATGSQSAKLKSLSGVTDLIIEEAEEVESFEEFSKVDESIRMKGVDLTITLVYNPTSSAKSWIHKEWFIDGKPNPERDHDTVYIHSTYLDNIENLAESTVRRYEDLKESNPTYYINTILAQWTLEVTGRIYAGWRSVDVLPTLPPNEVWKTWYGMDFGYGASDKTSLIEINYTTAFSQKGQFFIRERFSKRFERIGLTVDYMRLHCPDIYNQVIIADNASPTMWREVKAGGFSKCKPCRKGKVENKVAEVQDLDITIVGDSPALTHSYNTFGRLKNGQLPHEPDELAALRYGVTYSKMSGGKLASCGARVIPSNGLV